MKSRQIGYLQPKKHFSAYQEQRASLLVLEGKHIHKGTLSSFKWDRLKLWQTRNILPPLPLKKVSETSMRWNIHKWFEKFYGFLLLWSTKNKDNSVSVSTAGSDKTGREGQFQRCQDHQPLQSITVK